MSPIAPLTGEWLYQQLNSVTEQEEDSVHLSFYPVVEETAIDKQLEKRMAVGRIISSIVLRVRKQIDINVRHPLAKIILPMKEDERLVVDASTEINIDEVNVKET